MTPDPEKYGRTEIAPIHMLEPAAFDFFDGQPPPPGLGQTETPVNILPAFEIDMGEPATTPTLVLTFKLRPDATAATIGADLVRAWRVLSDYERSLNGYGLNPGEASDERTPDGDVIRWVLTAANPAGAANRLAKLAEAVNTADPAVPKDALAGRSFDACRAELRTAA